MTRKRFVKLMMSFGYSRNEANSMAQYERKRGIRYEDAYYGSDSRMLAEEFPETLRNALQEIAAYIRRCASNFIC